MNKLMKNKKKKGFTLVELIAVIAIIGILAAIIVPTVSKYTEKAKISKAKEEMRQFVMACETAIADEGVTIADSATPAGTAALTGDALAAVKQILDPANLTKIKTITLAQCKISVNNPNAKVVVDGKGNVTAVTAS